MSRLKDKIIIVTGGSGLIGKGIVNKITEEGGIAINADINVLTNNDLSNILCDITNENSIQNVVDTIISKYGKIDGLVNNAYPRSPDWGRSFENVSYESWRTNIDWQLNSVFIFCKKVLVEMKKRSSGSIVNIGSTYGVVSPDFSIYEGTTITSDPTYSAIKGGVINFTKYLAAYFGEFGIRANCISPGGIFDNQNPLFVERYTKKVPLKRMGTPADIAGPVSFLLSQDAKYITGHNLMVDGGWTII
jgi:NAD(P)-dependent dehydrogenase (short-subunit alcohol dehydrogenase family)